MSSTNPRGEFSRTLQMRLQNAEQRVCQLPPELMLEIFEIGLAIAMLTRQQDRFLKSVTAVCHRWRQCAIRNPALWAFAVFVETPEGCSSLAKLASYLTRSGVVELDLVVHIVGDSPTFGRFFQLIQPHLLRCRTLTISMVHPRGGFPSVLLHGPLPCLRDLSIVFHPATDNTISDARPLFATPLLCTVQYLRLELSHDTVTNFRGINTTALEDVSLRIPRLQHHELAWLIANSPLLRTLALHDVDDFAQTFAAGAPIEAPHIQTLVLDDCCLSTRVLECPGLESLALGLHGGLRDYAAILPSISPFPQLRHISLGIILDIPNLPALAVAFIRTCHNLSSLQLYAERSSVLLLRELSAITGAGSGLPQSLRMIRILRLPLGGETGFESMLDEENTMYELVQVMRACLQQQLVLTTEWNQEHGWGGHPVQMLALKARGDVGDRVVLLQSDRSTMSFDEDRD